MPHDNTAPAIITDKNGKVTTVHKRIAPKSTSGVSIPAPTAGSAKAKPKSKSQSKVIEVPEPVDDPVTVVDAEGIPRHSVTGDDLRLYRDREDSSSIPARNDANASILIGLLEQYNGGRKMGMDKMVFVINADNTHLRTLIEGYKKPGFGELMNAATSSQIPDNRRLGAREMAGIALMYEPELFDDSPFPASVKATKSRMAHHKLREYKGLYFDVHRMIQVLGVEKRQARDFAALPAQRREQVQKLGRLQKAVAEVDDNIGHRDNAALTEWAFSDGVDADEVTGLIKEHGTVDRNQLAGMVQGVNPSISGGWL